MISLVDSCRFATGPSLTFRQVPLWLSGLLHASLEECHQIHDFGTARPFPGFAFVRRCHHFGFAGLDPLVDQSHEIVVIGVLVLDRLPATRHFLHQFGRHLYLSWRHACRL